MAGFDRTPPLEEQLSAWLRTRDAGPAPERLRMRVARVADVEPRARWRRAWGSVLRPAAALAAIGAFVVLAAVALSLRGAVEPGPGASAQPAPTAVPTWSSAPAGPIAPGYLLGAIAIASGLALAAIAGVALQTRMRDRARSRAATVEAPLAGLEPQTVGATEGEASIAAPPPSTDWAAVDRLSHAHSWRRLLVRLAAILGALVVGAGAVTVTGLVPLPGGPLCTAQDCGFLWLRTEGDYGNAMGITGPVGVRGYDSAFALVNSGPVPLEVDRITPRVSDPGLVIDGVFVTDGWLGDAPDVENPTASGRLTRLPAEVRPSQGDGVDPAAAREVYVIFHATSPGYHYYTGFDIDYHVGSLRFHQHAGQFVSMCVTPLPAGYACPSQDFRP